MIKAALIVGLGSFLGGALRYLSVVWIERKAQMEFPLAILTVNVVGSFLIGFVTPSLERVSLGGEPYMALFLTAGMLGGFTTFSTFSLQTLKLAQSGQWSLALLNAAASLLCCIVSVFAGLKIGQLVFR